jgi:nucleotide-binding universal stress UspA family protein
VSTILIGVDDSTRSEDAVAFGRRLAGGSDGRVIVASAFPYSDTPSRSTNLAYRDALKRDAGETVRRMSELLSSVPAERIHIAVEANASPAHALHDLAQIEDASIVVVGHTRTGHAGRVLPGATAERLLHGAPCPVAVVPDGYRTTSHPAIRRIGVAYDGSDESTAAVSAAVDAARALGAELEVIGVVSSELYGAPVMMGGPSYIIVRDDVVRIVKEGVDAVVAELPDEVRAEGVVFEGDPVEQIAARTADLDLLVIGSRGYGPLRSVLVGGVSGRVAREAQCPVIVVPRGIEAPLGELFGSAATTARTAAGRP